MDNVKEVILKDGRFYVRAPSPCNGAIVMMPRANYVWLKYNPGFEEIPKGYVIHHLDHDQTNDDPSNLVLMYKHHHVAHHWKQKTTDIPVTIGQSDNAFAPLRRPGIAFDKKMQKWQLLVREEPGFNGNKTSIRRLTTYRGESLPTREAAEAARDDIWNRWKNVN